MKKQLEELKEKALRGIENEYPLSIPSEKVLKLIECIEWLVDSLKMVRDLDYINDFDDNGNFIKARYRRDFAIEGLEKFNLN